ncbi:hypothetical protein [Methylobacter tundripaludum]|uniref:Uncharacterized protein n=1 Tax=Methylobacter tundripaludum (strain ATCC BAA-1195 / DSM 17260 / SV96) TaxID=697282 RepID=G3IRF0_METTV|nr:hypothetical protein [Methylobacter tundripaludum]EGW22161.1 hypothetical protein Mettu_0962 [Methylobacter tundripaludum SV96]
MTATTFEAFHAAIKDQIAAFFGANVNTVEWYEQGEDPDSRPRPIKTPAIILELESFIPGDDIGDGRTPLDCQITANCILGRSTPNLQIQTSNFAAQFLANARNNKWGLAHDASFPSGFTAGPGKFDPEKNGYESWFVTWGQTFYLGNDVWAPTGITPTEVWLGLSPEIGIPYVDKYIKETP